jgi:hypothetical protein
VGEALIDWQWIPGLILGGTAGGHSLWLRRYWSGKAASLEDDLRRQIDTETERGLINAARQQLQHAGLLWPHPWQGDRPLTQVEELAQAGRGWLGYPLDPEEQQAQMMTDSQAILDSYKLRTDDNSETGESE